MAVNAKFLTSLLCIGLICLPVQQPRAQLAPAICIVVVTAAAVVGVVVIIKSCEPVYYCVRDEENRLDYCKITTKRDAELEGLTVKAGPFKDAVLCDHACHPTNLLTKAVSPPLVIERSTNLIHWVECARLLNQFPDCFEWSETNAMNVSCFYRVRQ